MQNKILIINKNVELLYYLRIEVIQYIRKIFMFTSFFNHYSEYDRIIIHLLIYNYLKLRQWC